MQHLARQPREFSRGGAVGRQTGIHPYVHDTHTTCTRRAECMRRTRDINDGNIILPPGFGSPPSQPLSLLSSRPSSYRASKVVYTTTTNPTSAGAPTTGGGRGLTSDVHVSKTPPCYHLKYLRRQAWVCGGAGVISHRAKAEVRCSGRSTWDLSVERVRHFTCLAVKKKSDQPCRCAQCLIKLSSHG